MRLNASVCLCSVIEVPLSALVTSERAVIATKDIIAACLGAYLGYGDPRAACMCTKDGSLPDASVMRMRILEKMSVYSSSCFVALETLFPACGC